MSKIRLFIKPTDDPAYMDESLNSIVPIDPSEPYIMHQVIEKIVDQGTFLEIQPNWARNAIVGLARIGGHSVGVVGAGTGHHGRRDRYRCGGQDDPLRPHV